ncbi:MAG: hypothetical protein D6762_05055 [Candidatus Neomarinimicrobiota bacterium]|nr:MAG: hypothetical protein D6762_05055 [Candidatus Neomarinimicrobiota bacterium]
MKIKVPSVHLDHMLKQTRNHHAQLSQMADVKANMLLTIASVVITISVPHLVDPNLRWAALVLILFCLATIVLSTYAVMPKIPVIYSPQLKKRPISDTFNVHFFGDFARLSYSEYADLMEDVLNDPDKTYESMVKEIYTLGVFLAKKKYRFIRLSYLVFILGFFASVITMVLTSGLVISFLH